MQEPCIGARGKNYVSKNEGGMCFQDLSKSNIALLAKKGW